MDQKDIRARAKADDLEMAKILCRDLGPDGVRVEFGSACYNGHVKIVEWMCDEYNMDICEGFIDACKGGHRAVADLMMARGAVSRVATKRKFDGMGYAINLARENGWIDIANQFVMRLALMNMPKSAIIQTYDPAPQAAENPAPQAAVNPVPRAAANPAPRAAANPAPQVAVNPAPQAVDGPALRSITHRLKCIAGELAEIAAELDIQRGQ